MTDWMAMCERCNEEVPLEQMEKCPWCDLDPLCDDCLLAHTCDS